MLGRLLATKTTCPCYTGHIMRQYNPQHSLMKQNAPSRKIIAQVISRFSLRTVSPQTRAQNHPTNPDSWCALKCSLTIFSAALHYLCDASSAVDANIIDEEKHSHLATCLALCLLCTTRVWWCKVNNLVNTDKTQTKQIHFWFRFQNLFENWNIKALFGVYTNIFCLNEISL